MTALRWVFLVGVGIGAFLITFDAAIDVQDAYALACRGRPCLSIETEIYLLKLCAIVASIAIPAALAWVLDRRGHRS